MYAAGPDAAHPPSWLDGANCQRYAYGVLSLFGLRCPPLRSSDLWADQAATLVAAEPRPLDLVLFSGSGDAYGAHLGVWMADDQVLHLSAQVGSPAAWSLDEFGRDSRYATVVGFKRVRCGPGAAPAAPPAA